MHGGESGSAAHIFRFPQTRRLDTESLREPRRYLSQLMLGRARVRAVLNLERVVLITSEAIGMLVAMSNALRSRGGQLHVSGVSDSKLDFVEVTRLQGVVKIYCTTHEAVESFI